MCKVSVVCFADCMSMRLTHDAPEPASCQIVLSKYACSQKANRLPCSDSQWSCVSAASGRCSSMTGSGSISACNATKNNATVSLSLLHSGHSWSSLFDHHAVMYVDWPTVESVVDGRGASIAAMAASTCSKHKMGAAWWGSRHEA